MSDLRLLSRIALCGLVLAAATPAAAGTVIIDSDVAGPVNVISRDQIEVLPNASISGGLTGIVGLGENRVTIRREGRVEGTTWGLQLEGDTSVINQGQVLGGVFGIQFNQGGAFLDNSGKVMGGTFAVFALGDVEIINSGKIDGGVFGVQGLGAIDLINKGSIRGGTFGVQALEHLGLSNWGSIHGGVFGVQAIKNGFFRNWGEITGGTFGIQTIGELDLYNWGNVRGGVFGVQAIESARIRNWGLIEGGTFGIQVIRDAELWNWGRINGGVFGVDVIGSAEVHNFNTIEAGIFGLSVQGDAQVWNYGRLTGGIYGLEVGGNADVRNWGYVSGGIYGMALNDHARVWNWGEIRGDQVAGVQANRNLFLRNGGLIWGGTYGVLALGENNRIENFGAISGGEFGILTLGSNARVMNHGTLTGEGPDGYGVYFEQDGDHRLDNFGVVRGGRASVALDNPSRLTLGGTGYYIGDVLGTFADGDTLRLDLVGVPKEVKQSLLRRQGALGGPLYIPVFNIHAREFERLEIERLISFQEEAGDDFGSVGRALDWRDITRDGSKAAFVEGFGSLVEDPEAFRDALENVSGRSISHSLSDMAFANSHFWNQDLAHYFDLKRNKAEADAKSGLETSPWGGFAKTTGIFADQDRTENRQDGDWTVHGAFMGGDYTCDDDVTIGGFGGYTRSEADVDDFGSTLSSDDVHGGFYVGSRVGKLSLDGAAWYSHHDYDSKRVFELPTFSQQAQAKFDADQVSTYLRASYNWRPSLDERFEISPRLGLGYSHLWVDGWKEHSQPSRLGLQTEDQEADSLRTSLGARVSSRIDFGKVVLQPEFRVDWMHEYLDDGRSIQGKWSSSAFQPFETESEVDDRDSAIVGAGLTLNVPVCDCMKKLEFYAGYDAQLGRDEFKGQVANFRVSYQY